ncbi:hypothetical protein T439DRAFT_323469 [Meredithblackwellia eburnea MCA 4105]
MRTRFALLSVISLVLGVHAKYDNTAEAATIAAQSQTLSGDGAYIITNVATGQTLSFIRETTMNVYPQDTARSVDIQFNSLGQARISGGNNKCISAQWTVSGGRGFDNAAVSYACAVGTGLLTGSATLERPKQWWYLVPAGSIKSSLVSSDSDSRKREKRSHRDMKRRLDGEVEKRGTQTTYYIIAFDHIFDMETRAIGSDSISTPGGYTSTVLNPWDTTDKSQTWTISSA